MSYHPKEDLYAAVVRSLCEGLIDRPEAALDTGPPPVGPRDGRRRPIPGGPSVLQEGIGGALAFIREDRLRLPHGPELAEADALDRALSAASR